MANLTLPNGVTLVGPYVETFSIGPFKECKAVVKGRIYEPPAVNAIVTSKFDALQFAKIHLSDIIPRGKSLHDSVVMAGRQIGKTTMMKAWMDECMEQSGPKKCIFIPIGGGKGIVLAADDLDVFDEAYIVDGDPVLGKLVASADPVDIRIIDVSRIGKTPVDPVIAQAARDHHRAKLMEELAQLDKEDLKI